MAAGPKPPTADEFVVRSQRPRPPHATRCRIPYRFSWKAHALLLMLFMIIDLDVPTNGTVVATDASVHGQGVCHIVNFTATGELDAKSREAQHTQLWDNCFGLVVMLRSFTSWRVPLTNWIFSQRPLFWLDGAQRQTLKFMMQGLLALSSFHPQV